MVGLLDTYSGVYTDVILSMVCTDMEYWGLENLIFTIECMYTSP